MMYRKKGRLKDSDDLLDFGVTVFAGECGAQAFTLGVGLMEGSLKSCRGAGCVSRLLQSDERRELVKPMMRHPIRNVVRI